MIMKLYEFENSLGWDFYDIPSLFVIVVIVAIVGVHCYKQHKRSKDAEEE
jgi:hypothetical protein